MRHLLPLLVILGLTPFALAEGGKFNLRTLAITPDEFPQLWALNGKNPVKLGFSPVQPSEVIRLNRTSPFPVYQGELNEKGTPADKSPAMLKLPDSPGILLLGWTQDGKARLLPLPDTPPDGKFNDWFVINATNKSIGVQIGATSKPVVFQPAAHDIMRITPPAGKGAAIVLASKEAEQWKKFFSTYWPVQADKRCLILIVQTGERVEARQIFEDLKREVPEDEK